GRVHVDVHNLRIHLHIDDDNRVLLLGKQRMVGIDDGLRQSEMSDMPLVHGKIDVVFAAAIHFPPYRITCSFEISILCIDPYSMAGNIEAVYATDDLL